MWAMTGWTTPWRCIVDTSSGGGEAIADWKAAASGTSALMATLLLPSAATWSTTFEPPMAPMLWARSALYPSQRSTSSTACVSTIFATDHLLDARGRGAAGAGPSGGRSMRSSGGPRRVALPLASRAEPAYKVNQMVQYPDGRLDASFAALSDTT